MDKKKLIVIIIGAILLLSVIVGIGLSRHQSSYEHQLSLAYKYLEEGNYQEAILAFTKAIGIDPNKPEGYLGRAEAYIESEETEETLTLALKDYEKVIELDETCADGYLGMADIYIRKGEYEKALDILKKALDKTSGNKRISDKITEIEQGNIKDAKGRIRKQTTFSPDGTIENYSEIEYRDGKPCIQYMYDVAGKLTSYAKYYYDKNDRKIKTETIRANGELEQYFTYEYNKDGQCITSNYYNNKNELFSVQKNEYDSDDNIVKSNFYEANGNLNFYFIYKYDDTGKCILTEQYDSNGELINYTKNE